MYAKERYSAKLTKEVNSDFNAGSQRKLEIANSAFYQTISHGLLVFHGGY